MSPRTRFLPALLVLALACVTNHARAQRYLLKDNSVIPANAATLRDGQLIATANFAGGGVFERRIALGDIARLDFPIPDGLAEAEAALLAGNHAESLRLVTPIYQRFAPFAAIPGSYFVQAARLRLQAQMASGDEANATATANELIRLDLSPEIKGIAHMALAEIVARKGQPDVAALMIEEIVKDAPPVVQARAWLLRGELATRRAAHEEAAEAFLRVQAFYGDQESLMPAALLGAGRALRAYGDKAMSERILGDLLDNYPGTAEAAAAKKELGF